MFFIFAQFSSQSFLQEKGVSASTKINIASFLELEARNLLFTVSDIELTYSTFKKAFLTTVGESAAIIKGQCLVSMTTILLQLFGKKEVENEVIGLFSEHLLFLLALVQQSNNPSNVYVRFMAANCLTEVELNFPRILRECINNLYSLSLIETSVAHQQYMCLLALTVKNSVASESLETLWGKSPKILFKDKLHQVDETELMIADINQMVSFLLDQLVLCTKEGSFWIICLVMEMMRSRTDLQMSVQVLKPILIHNLRVYNPQSFHNHFGSMLFEEKDRTALLNQTLVNATHPSLPACLKLLYLDWTGSYFQGDTPQTPQVTKLVPGVFDGPETQLKKLHILSGFLKNKSGASVLLLQASANLQSQVRPGSSIKYKAAFTRVLYRYLCDHPTTDIINKVPNLVLATALQDMSYIPFALDLVRCLHNTPELSAVSATIFEPLVSVFSQPDSPTTLATLPHVLLIFQHEILCREICQPQRTLLYLAEHVLTKEVCEVLSWSLGHQILSLCHSYMKEFDVTECFNGNW
uniref:AP5B1 middle domain-containing protein n=1 Tax=Timema tahoe TaxID=61484 RepID=A0A7R9NV65_9NEOP|nr:unnamed protein product [Timema tahoe]